MMKSQTVVHVATPVAKCSTGVKNVSRRKKARTSHENCQVLQASAVKEKIIGEICSVRLFFDNPTPSEWLAFFEGDRVLRRSDDDD